MAKLRIGQFRLRSLVFWTIAAGLFCAFGVDRQAVRRRLDGPLATLGLGLPQSDPWDPRRVGNGMFQSASKFAAYVQASEFVGEGTLLSWHDRKGTVAVDEVYLGRRGLKQVSFFADGGFPEAKPGQKVIFLLRRRDGQIRLNAHCAASGIYQKSAWLERFVKGALSQPTAKPRQQACAVLFGEKKEGGA